MKTLKQKVEILVCPTKVSLRKITEQLINHVINKITR